MMSWIARFKQHSVVQQTEHETDTNLAFTIPREFLTHQNLPSISLFHGGIDSPSLNVFDPVLKQPVHITKYLCFKSKTSTQTYLDHLYERILLTSSLSHPNVRRILSWYIADGCLYSITGLIQTTLRHAIQSEKFPIERIQRLAAQIIEGTIYLQSKGLCPLTPWYTTNIELTSTDRVRLCSPTICMGKLNGGVVAHHHLWRHAPESLFRMIIAQESQINLESLDHSKEDVWSIGCIIIEMLINRILFHPQNDDPSLQLFCIVQYVGGLTDFWFDRFPPYVKRIFSTIKFDSHQHRLRRLLEQIFHQYQLNSNDFHHLLTGMFQFQPEKRFSLQSAIEHPFFSCNSNRQISPMITENLLKTRKGVDDLIHLCAKLQLEKGRWMLTLKERCLLQMISQIDYLNEIHLDRYGLSRGLQDELRQLIEFFTGNQ